MPHSPPLPKNPLSAFSIELLESLRRSEEQITEFESVRDMAPPDFADGAVRELIGFNLHTLDLLAELLRARVDRITHTGSLPHGEATDNPTHASSVRLQGAKP